MRCHREAGSESSQVLLTKLGITSVSWPRGLVIYLVPSWSLLLHFSPNVYAAARTMFALQFQLPYT